MPRLQDQDCSGPQLILPLPIVSVVVLLNQLELQQSRETLANRYIDCILSGGPSGCNDYQHVLELKHVIEKNKARRAIIVACEHCSRRSTPPQLLYCSERSASIEDTSPPKQPEQLRADLLSRRRGFPFEPYRGLTTCQCVVSFASVPRSTTNTPCKISKITISSRDKTSQRGRHTISPRSECSRLRRICGSPCSRRSSCRTSHQHGSVDTFIVV